MEQAIGFECEGEALTGVLALPERAGTDVGVLVIVGGPQYRAGSHRQFVLLARHLAAGGYPTLRFDVRGMGDSSGQQRGFESISDDIDTAIEAFFAAQAQLKRVVLWGLCDGASAALIYCSQQPDRRIAGLCLANPWVRSEATHARTQVKHYYRNRLREPAFWSKLLSGRVALGAVAGLWQALRRARHPGTNASVLSFQDRMHDGWMQMRVPKILILSSEDHTAKEFEEYVRLDSAWQAAIAAADVVRFDLTGADHTFSTAAHRHQVEAATLSWLDQQLCEFASPAWADVKQD